MTARDLVRQVRSMEICQHERLHGLRTKPNPALPPWRITGISLAFSLLNTRLQMLKQRSAPLKAPPSPSVSPTSLLRLPFEVRLQIYYYCIPRKHVIEVSNPHFHIGWTYKRKDYTVDLEDTLDFEDDTVGLDGTLGFEDDVVGDAVYSRADYWNRKKNNSIFLISKQISKEALDILYGENIFKLRLHGNGGYYLKKNFAEGNRRRMRYLLLIAQHVGISYEPGRIPDNAVWSSILPTLKGLRIVAEQPVEASSYHGAPSLEQEIDRWVKWIRPFLQCFGQYLSKETLVQVDIDGRAETRKLVKECLPHGYQEIQCRHIGDLIFKRGRFLWESGYCDDDDRINSRDADWN